MIEETAPEAPNNRFPGRNGGSLQRGRPGARKGASKVSFTKEIDRVFKSEPDMPAGFATTRLRNLMRAGVEVSAPQIIRLAQGKKPMGLHKDAAEVTYKEQIAAFVALGRFGVGELQGVLVDTPEVLRIVSSCLGQIMLRAASELVTLDQQDDRVRHAEKLYQACMQSIFDGIHEHGK